jgi:hypothetical protein
MRCWAAVVSGETYATERLYAFGTLTLPALPDSVAPGECVALVVADESGPRLFGLGRFRVPRPDGRPEIAYTHRIFDAPVPVELDLPAGLSGLTTAEYERLAALIGADRRTDADKSEWFVSVTLPIEAVSPAEAVREFWTHIDKLGPRELPAYVWPQHDERAMQSYLQGSEAPQDPEDD